VAFAVNENDGRWRRLLEVPGSGRLGVGGGADIKSVSCSKAGYCSAGGSYVAAHNKVQAFVATEWSGRWGMAIEVHGTGPLNAGGLAGTDSVSCAAPGDCSAGGYYTDKGGHQQAFVVSESDQWGTAIEVPGLARLNIGGLAEVNSVWCATADHCTAGGDYASSKNGLGSQAYLVTQR
jgi:hypothetical protein